MDTTKTVAGVLIGIGIGTLIGVLFAPDKGSRTRRKILDKGQDYADELKDKFENVYQDAIEKYDNFVDGVDAKVASRK